MWIYGKPLPKLQQKCKNGQAKIIYVSKEEIRMEKEAKECQ